MKRLKNRSAERLEVRNLLAADLGFDEEILLPPSPNAELGPPAIVSQDGRIGRGTPPVRPDNLLPPRGDVRPVSETIEARNY